MTRLPVELTDRIIDYHHAHRRTLATCSLVCKSWVPASRYHFFRELRLNPHQPINILLELIQSPTSTLATCLPSLFIDVEPSMFHLAKNRFFTQVEPIMCKFDGVRSLRLRSSWAPKGEDVAKWYARITNLDVRLTRFYRPDDFFAFIALFHSLESLTLDLKNFEWSGPVDVNRKTPFSFPPSLRSIRIMRIGPKLEWLVPLVKFTAVTDVELHYVAQTDLPGVQQLLQSLGPSVQRLLLNFDSPNLDMDLDLPDLRHNTKLRSLRVSGIQLYKDDGRCSFRKFITNVFSQISSERMVYTELEVFVVKSDNLDMVDWNELAQILSRPQFSGLYKVHVIVRAFNAPDILNWVERIRNELYDLRHVLEVSLRSFL